MEQDAKRSFWTTLPGILTSSAAVIAALGTLVVSLAQVGLVGKKQVAEPSVVASPVAGVTQAGPQEARPPGDIILGTWRQEIFTSPSDIVDAGTFIVSKVDGRYVMGAQEQTQRSGLLSSVALSNVTSDGTVWTFQSNLTDGSVVMFRLRRISNSVFEGEATQTGQVTLRNRWIRVQP